MEEKSRKGSLYSRIAVLGFVLVLIGAVFALKQLRSGSVFGSPAAGDHPSLYVVEPFDLEELRSSGLPLLISYGSDSCAACKEMKPILEELHTDLAGRAILLVGLYLLYLGF